MTLLRKNTVVTILLMMGLVSPGPVNAGSVDDQPIRIAILQQVNEIEISIRNRYTIEDPLTGTILKSGYNFHETTLTLSNKGIRLGPEDLSLSRLRFLASKDVTLRVNGKDRKYRGFIDIIRTRDNHLLAVNTIGLEDYIRGVLYHEVSHRWPLDAILAQAIAARSYALYQIQTRKKQEFDVTNDIYSQVYGGKTSEKFRTNLAINRSRGKVLVYKGKVLPAYFHATCGGHTENVNELWKHDLPPLRGVVCEFCRISPHYSWRREFQSSAVQKLLNQKGYMVGLIKEIKVSKTTASGRVRELTITDRAGKSVRVFGKDFRDILGPNNLRSNKYDIEMKGYFFDVIGRGWGHGVGLCQWGAYGMSLQHHDYDEILQFYYPGAEIADYRDLKK